MKSTIFYPPGLSRAHSALFPASFISFESDHNSDIVTIDVIGF